MTNHYEIITSWIDSCETELQLDNLRDKIENVWILDGIVRDHLIEYLGQNDVRRDWARSKATLLGYNWIEEMKDYKEPQPTDSAWHL